ncbi:MAG: hypothetical protein EOM67_02405 [Spirochaetia bacterium]|nr:hypothetical protein [Spirochaetia bacterium]
MKPNVKNIVLVTTFLVVTTFSLFSSSPTFIIPMDSFIYDDVEALYLVSGYGTPSNKRPWSSAEATLILSRIDESRLSDGMKEFYQGIKREIDKEVRYSYDGLVDLGFYFDLNAEMYTHSNIDEYTHEQDWVVGFPERKPMFRLRFDMSFSDFLYIYSDLQYGRNRFRFGDDFGRFNLSKTEGIIKIPSGVGSYLINSSIYNRPFLTNWMSSTYDIDFQTPKRALISTGGDNWNLSLSRDKIRWGNGHSGNFVISDHDDYQEYVRFVTFSDRFSYDWTNMFFETNIHTGEGNSQDEEFKMFMAHRLEFRPIDRITFAISENVMYQNDVFSLRHLNPANVFHNLNSRTMFNAIAHVELDVMIIDGLNIYGQFVLDQARAPNEGATQADASGYLVGVEYAHSLSKGILFSSLEFATTSPALYRRELVDFLTFRRYHGNGTSFVSHIDYLGYEYGGDANVLQLDVAYRLPKDRIIALELIWMRHGEINYFTPNSVVNSILEASPSGLVVQENLSVALSGNFGIENLISFVDADFYANLAYVGKRDYTKATKAYSNENSDVQFTLGVSFTL